jgi:hypothetical protein
MIGKKSRSKGDYNPYQSNMSGGYAAAGDGVAEGTSNFQPSPEALSNLVSNQALPVKGEESTCSGTCEVSWKPVKAPGN